MRSQLKALVERQLNVRIIRNLPVGFSEYDDLRRLRAWTPNGVIFDVGANIGQTVLSLSTAFPEASIYTFEPSPTSFEEMTRRTAAVQNVQRFNFAFGAEPGTAELFVHRKSEQSTLRRDLSDAPGFSGGLTATVQVRTLDDFLAERTIDFVQYLKIDTEGFDLEVLNGANAALKAHRIGMIQVEAGFSQDEGKFIPLERFRTVLREHGYLLFGIYEQVRVHQTQLRRCNAMFVSEKFAG